MPYRSPSKQRLEELIALARTYRGWSSKDLARELGRDVHHLVPNSGVPKLDIVVALAEALDWTVQDVVDDLYGNVPSGVGEKPGESWAELDRGAWEALQKGDYSKAASIARREFFAATNGTERAMACIRECGAWDGVGRYLVALECAQRGLAAAEPTSDLTATLRNNLANCHYTLGNYEEAAGIATRTLLELERGRYECRAPTATTGYAMYVRGMTTRAVLADRATDTHPADIEQALADLSNASLLLRNEAERQGAPYYLGIAKTADGGKLAIEAFAGRVSAGAAIEHFLSDLDWATDIDASAGVHELAAVGWCCIFACEVASGLLERPEEIERLLGIFTNKADQIAEKLDNWSLRERVWRLELLRRVGDAGVTTEPWVLDQIDARELSGTMARFPNFRRVGWRIFRSATIGDER